MESNQNGLLEGLDEALAAIQELIDAEEFDEAEEAVEQALERFGDVAELFVLRAEVALDREEYEECLFAVEDGLKRVESDEVRGQLLRLKGDALYHQDKLQEARQSFNEAIRVGGATWSGLMGRAIVHEELRFLRAALLDLERAIALDDQEPQPFVIRGSIAIRAGQLEEAKKDYEHALALDAYDEEARLYLARLQALGGQSAEAIETLELLVEEGEDPDFLVPAALLRSQLSLPLGSTEVAKEDAQLAIDNAPDEPWGYLQLAACYLHEMQAGEAVAAVKEALEKVKDERDLPDGLILMATAYEQLEKPERAAELRGRAEGVARLPEVVYGPYLNPAGNIPVNPNRPFDVRGLLGQLFGDPAEAPEGYEKAIRQIIDRLPELIKQHPEAREVRIELPPVPGRQGPPPSLVVQVNQGARPAGAANA